MNVIAVAVETAQLATIPDSLFHSQGCTFCTLEVAVAFCCVIQHLLFLLPEKLEPAMKTLSVWNRAQRNSSDCPASCS